MAYTGDMMACVCTFRRERTSKIERGIAVGLEPGVYDVSHITDGEGKIVEGPIWSYTLHPHEGCIAIKV